MCGILNVSNNFCIFSYQLTSGKAEIFGSELVKNHKYSFTSGSKVAVFTWHGCLINMWGKTEVAYTASNTPMVMYMNIHSALEQMRIKADTEMSRGPRVSADFHMLILKLFFI